MRLQVYPLYPVAALVAFIALKEAKGKMTSYALLATSAHLALPLICHAAGPKNIRIEWEVKPAKHLALSDTGALTLPSTSASLRKVSSPSTVILHKKTKFPVLMVPTITLKHRNLSQIAQNVHQVTIAPTQQEYQRCPSAQLATIASRVRDPLKA